MQEADEIEDKDPTEDPPASRKSSRRATQKNPRLHKFIELIADGRMSATAAYINAGYSPNGASVSASKLLADPIIQGLIEARKGDLARFGVWTREISIQVAQEEYLRWQHTRPLVAARYKENLDKLNGLLIEKWQDVTEKPSLVDLSKDAATSLSALSVSKEGIENKGEEPVPVQGDSDAKADTPDA